MPLRHKRLPGWKCPASRSSGRASCDWAVVLWGDGSETLLCARRLRLGLALQAARNRRRFHRAQRARLQEALHLISTELHAGRGPFFGGLKGAAKAAQLKSVKAVWPWSNFI